MYYVPLGGTPRAIKAIVRRQPPETAAELARGLMPSIEITVRNDSTHGISSAELNTGGDAIRVAEMIGGAAIDMLLNAPAKQSAAWLVFRLGAK